MSKKNIIVSKEELDIQKDFSKQNLGILSNKFEHPPLAYVHSYGCQQNVNDGEKIKGILALMGYGFTDTQDNADLVLYNTCAVRENAEDRVFGNVGALKHPKRRNPNMIIALCGCMMQQKHIADKIKFSYPHVDIVFGTHVMHKIPEMINNVLLKQKRVFNIEDSDGVIVEDNIIKRDGNFKAWVPIMYGCNNFCTYCIVPYVRGRERSRDSKEILKEVKDLVENGYKEITLLGQNVNSYGNDNEQEINFASLLKLINQIEGDFRIRFMSSHPKDITYELIDTIAECDKVCNHIHLPIQCGSNRILKLMNRHYTKEQYLNMIDYAKNKIPNLSLTSDIIVGFPGETYQDFLETVDVIEKVKYVSLFTFIYSKRVGTKAEKIEDNISKDEKSKWFNELLEKQRKIGIEKYASLVGQTLTVLVEGKGKTGDDYLTGRSEGYIIVDFEAPKSLIGQFVNVKITKALNWAVLGEIIN